MKIRMGFVSNSSSSSFCLLGASVYDPQKQEEFVDILDSLLHRDLAYYQTYDDGQFLVVGTPIDYIDENKTIKELKKDVAERLNKTLKTQYKPEDIEFITGELYNY